MVPSTVSQGYSTSVSFVAGALDNPACGASSGTKNGWLLKRATTSELGLPASGSTVNQFVLPLSAG